MLQGLLMMEDGDGVLPFVRCFYGSPSTYMWEDEMGVSQDLPQGEGGEQGDPLMPMLFALGQHRVLVAIQERLWEGERVYSPERVTDICAIIQQELFAHARISVHHGKTQVWNRGGVEPQDIDIITAEARIRVPGAVVWRGAQELPATRQGLKVLGAPIGHPQYVQEFLRRKSEEQQVLFQRIPFVNDPQASWLLLWMCASTRANFWLRMVSPELTLPFAELHDRNVWQRLQTILDVRGAPAEAQQFASLPLTLGGVLAMVVPDHVEEVEPNQSKFGWQQCASWSLERARSVWPGMTDAERVLLRSQRGPLASTALTVLG